jgi:hypothetical protein
MDEPTFWNLIESSRGPDQPEVLQKKLEALPAGEIVEFDRLFKRLLDEAYTWDLWAAAYIIEGGCSDDGFADFRAGLIGFGREVFYAAVRDPNTLAEQPAHGVDFSVEEMAYAARRAYESITGEEMPDHDLVRHREPTGARFDHRTVDEKYPELAKKFGNH